MIVGYHCIFGMYGFWLPNDPRGSWSEFVGSWELFRYGKATKTDVRGSVGHQSHDRGKRLAAKSALKREPVRLTGLQARAVARGFAEYAEKSQLRACAIMPDHVHLVLGRMRLNVEQAVIQLKAAATKSLVAEGLHPFQVELGTRPPKCFAQRGWNVFLDREDVPRAIEYAEENPVKKNLPRQSWWFVTPYLA